jgi:hypothetical protein
MTPQCKIVVAAASSFIAGALVAGVVSYVGFSRYVRNELVPSFYATAVHAQFEVRTLSTLHAGQLDKVVHDLDLLLDSHTMQLAEYETVVGPPQRDPFVYRTLAEVRDYRAQFPTHFEYPLQQERYQKALDLGKKAGG